MYSEIAFSFLQSDKAARRRFVEAAFRIIFAITLAGMLGAFILSGK
jgi:hypothetical protein